MSRGEKVKGLNEKLQAAFPERTLDAIKSRRRNSEHKQMLEEASKRLELRASTVVTEIRQSSSDDHPEQDEWQCPQGQEEGQPDCDLTSVVTGMTLRLRRKAGRYHLQAIQQEESQCPEDLVKDQPDCDQLVTLGRTLRPKNLVAQKRGPLDCVPTVEQRKILRPGRKRGQSSPRTDQEPNVTNPGGPLAPAGDWEDDGVDLDAPQQGPTLSQRVSPWSSGVIEQAAANPCSGIEQETKELTGAPTEPSSEIEHHGTVPDQDFQVAIVELAADLALDVYGGEVLKSIAVRACAAEEVNEDLEEYLTVYFVRQGKEAPITRKNRPHEDPNEGNGSRGCLCMQEFKLCTRKAGTVVRKKSSMVRK
ncbi:unnamed protein product [Ixodes pacificus]